MKLLKSFLSLAIAFSLLHPAGIIHTQAIEAEDIDANQVLSRLLDEWDHVRSTFREARDTCSQKENRREIRRCQKKLRQKLRKVRKSILNLKKQFTALEKEVNTIRSSRKKNTTASKPEPTPAAPSPLPAPFPNTADTSDSISAPVAPPPAGSGSLLLEALPLERDGVTNPAVLTRDDQKVARLLISNTGSRDINLDGFHFLCTGEWSRNAGAIDNIIWARSTDVDNPKSTELLKMQRSDRIFNYRNCSQEVRVTMIEPLVIPAQSGREIDFYYDTDAGGQIGENFQMRFTSNTFVFTDDLGREIIPSIGNTNAAEGDISKSYLYGEDLIYYGLPKYD